MKFYLTTIENLKLTNGINALTNNIVVSRDLISVTRKLDMT